MSLMDIAMQLPFVKKQKKAEKTFDSEMLEVDFFSQLAYMAAVATSGLSRANLFYQSAKLPYSATKYFRRVDFVAKMFNHDYSQACRLVGEKTKEPEIKALLLRLSGALASGEDISGFLSRESMVLSQAYGGSYERRLALLKTWTDAYVSLILTSALVTVMSVVTMMIGSVSVGFMVSLAAVTIICTAAGSWFLFKTAPRESKNHSLPIRSKEQNIARVLMRLLFPMGGVIIAGLVFVKADLGLIFLTASAFMFPVGLVLMTDDSKVGKRDADMAAFLRSLGGIMQAIGATAAEAISRLDFRSLGILKEDVGLLHTRLLAGISPTACWDRFICETGSELVNRSVRTFCDGISLGGEPQNVGNEASAFALKVSLLRAQRSQISSGFTWLTVAMHAVLVTLSVFIYSVFVSFAELTQKMMPSQTAMNGLPSGISLSIMSFNDGQVEILHFMVMLIVFVLTAANAFAIYSVSGGHTNKLIFYLSLTTGISGGVLTLVPVVAGMIFKIV
jgi:archaeal flagellar protein FlaJ